MAEEAIFPAQVRERAGKGAARAVRREGLVPGVIYGDNKEPQTIAVNPRVIIKQIELGLLFNTVYTIEVEGGQKEKALPRDVQFHPVTDQPLHIDFMRLRKGARINVNIPVSFINEEASEGLAEGGILSVVREEVELYCPVDAIPHEVVCDLSGTQIGDTLRISNVTLPESVEPVIQDRDFVVATVTQAIIVEEIEEEEEIEGEGLTEEEREAQAAEEGEAEESDDSEE